MTDFDELMRIQRLMASRIAQEVDTDNTIKLLSIIRDLSPTGKKIPKESVILEARAQGMLDTEVLRLLDQLKRDDMITEPEQGYVQPT
ncbi:hypothetical protein D6783_03115 [Candidatus Woesearchaeota archaeon]|nr:MAG: hypothetical protein D6783_03115 [Candidatus Woesearchaeota archaeon]